MESKNSKKLETQLEDGDWQDDCSDFKLRTKKILLSKLGFDCKLLVGAEPNQRIISGHKIILAMASTTFEKYFYGDFSKEEVIKVPDVDPNVFQMMIDFIYTDEVQIKNIDDSIDLFYVARKYWIKSLAKRCADYMLQKLNSTNVCKIYEFASLFEEYDLKKFCLLFISGRTKQVLNNENFLEIKLSTILTIFSLNQLNIQSELELWQALNNYAVANDYISQCTENKNDDISNNDTVREDDILIINKDDSLPKYKLDENLEEKFTKQTNVESSMAKNISDLREAAKRIRFLTLTAEEYSKMCINPEILGDSESFALIMNILNPFCSRSIPKGFCNFSCKRNIQHKIVGEIIIEGYDSINMYETSNIQNLPSKMKNVNVTRKQIPDFEMSFNVDKKITVKGLTIPTQKLQNLQTPATYTDTLSIYLLDDQDVGLIYTSYEKVVSYNTFQTITFPTSVLIQANRMYKIRIYFNRLGCYPMYLCNPEVAHQKGPHFLFFIKSSDNSFTFSLIKNILFKITA